MSTPAIDGPSRRAPLTIDELSAMALGRSSRASTISTTNAWRAGVSKALMSPWNAESASTCHTVMVPRSANQASSADCTIASACVTTSTRWRFQRSTSTPANGASRNVGICPAKPTTPSSSAEPVSR